MLDRLGVGYERMREVNPAIVFCAITGYGQDGPYAQRAGHDMNYLGLVGLLGLTGAKDGPPVQSAGQIADLGGGALMAAFGVMAALHERRRSGEGQLVDVSMADGALSWLAMVAGRYFCDGEVPRRGEQQLAGGLICYLPYEVADGWVSCGRSGAEVLGRPLQRRRPPGPDREAVRGARLRCLAARSRRSSARAPASSGLPSTTSTTAASSRSSTSTRRSTPSWCGRAQMVVELQPAAGSGTVRQLGVPVKLSRTPGDPTRPAPAFGEHTERGPARGRLLRRGGRGDARVRRRRRPGRRRRADGASAHERQGTEKLLRMGELAEASGVPAPTIKHYLREGLLPEPVKTSRNMAYYPPEFVDRIKLIKRSQEERFMPLKAIKSVLDEDPERASALLELEDRILDRALAGERARTSAAEVRERYGVPREVLDRLAELEVLTPNSRGYSPSDVKIIEAISRFRAGGYDEQIGFTVYDTLRYKTAIEELVRQEVDMVMNRLAGEVSPERVVEMLEAGAQPLQDLIAALHTKLMVAELERHRAARDKP